MRQEKTVVLQALALAAALMGAQAAHAQIDTSRLSVRLGATTIIPDVKSGNLSAPSWEATKIDIDSASQLTGGINYALTDNISLDVPLGLPFKFDVNGDGAIHGVGKLGDVKALPILLLAQYRVGVKNDLLRPYAGVGVNYTRFFKAKGTAALSGLTGGSPSDPTTLSMDNAWGAAVQAGVQVAINSKWSVDVNAIYVRLKTTGTLSTGQTIDTKLNPTAISVTAVYQF